MGRFCLETGNMEDGQAELGRRLVQVGNFLQIIRVILLVCIYLFPLSARACYSPRATTTNQPTNRAPNELARPLYAQESIFWGKNGRFLAKRPNYVGREQKFWYPQSKNHWLTLFALFYWLGIAPNGPCRPICGQIDDNCIFWAKNS